MSKQSDVEFLMVQAMEVFAEREHLASDKVLEVFQNAQIFEKILLQYEYLHQIDTEIILEDSRQLILHHGTVYDFQTVDLKKSHNHRDFGKGFYTTILGSQAKEWAYRMKLRLHAKEYYVYQYLFTENPELNVKRFSALDQAWWEFIKENRINGDVQHA